MRVAIVSPYDVDRPGGVQEHVALLAEELRAAGDRVVTIAPGRLDGEDVGGAIGIPFNGSVAPVALSPASARRTRRAIAEAGVDLVHVHEPAVPIVGLAALGSGLPTVTTHHAWADTPGLYGVVGRVLRRRIAAVEVGLAVSPAAAEHHARALGLPRSAFRIVPNGVDVERFRDARPLDRLAADAPILLFVGRLEPRKGFEQAIRAFARLKMHHPELRMVVVGDGPERERCQALLPAGLRVDVDMLGRVSVDDLPRCYASADVYVAPALGGESFGIVLLEAMAAGAAVVASDLPGFRSVVDDGVTGRLVPPGDPVALADAVDALLRNPSLRANQVTRAAEAVREYDWPWVAAQVRSAYVDALERGG